MAPPVKVGYVRTSKKDPNPDLRRRDFLHISSCKADRLKLRAALAYVREGDTLLPRWNMEVCTNLGPGLSDLRLHFAARRSDGRLRALWAGTTTLIFGGRWILLDQ